MTSAPPLVFLKLGGSLITEKGATTRVVRTIALERILAEVASARKQRPMRLVLAHGAGSFGHVEAKQNGTRDGVHSEVQWRGFLDVQQLHRHVLEAARKVGLPVMSFSASSSALCTNGSLTSLSDHQVSLALAHDLIPVLHGDVAFDLVRGGTIISTEEIFSFLALKLSPALVMIAGIEDGVLSSWPNGQVIRSLPLKEGEDGEAHVVGSHAADVTGGMRGKVKEARAILQRSSSLCAVVIFSGERASLVEQGLLAGDILGTIISRSPCKYALLRCVAYAGVPASLKSCLAASTLLDGYSGRDVVALDSAQGAEDGVEFLQGRDLPGSMFEEAVDARFEAMCSMRPQTSLGEMELAKESGVPRR